MASINDNAPPPVITALHGNAEPRKCAGNNSFGLSTNPPTPPTVQKEGDEFCQVMQTLQQQVHDLVEHTLLPQVLEVQRAGEQLVACVDESQKRIEKEVQVKDSELQHTLKALADFQERVFQAVQE